MCFREWLYQQRDREDAIGGLARQLMSDCISPLWSNRRITYRSYLTFRNADKTMLDALDAAFTEWSKLS
jgi:hypothetical protein